MAARALAPAPARAPEPGSTNRAQPARQAAKTNVPSGGAAISARGASSGVVNVSSSLFEPSQALAEEIEKAGPRGLDVRVIAKGLTEEGLIKVRQKGAKRFDSIGRGTMRLLNPWTQKLGGMYLNFEIDNSAIKNGFASFKARGGEKDAWLQALKKNADLLGGLGLNIESLPKPVNKFEQGKLILGVSGAKVLVGGYVDAKFDLLLENMEAPRINGSAEIDIRPAGKAKLEFDNPGNMLRGSVSLPVNFKSFSGAVKVAYLSDGTVDISGSAAYNANKLSGEIQFVATDLETANKFAKDALAAAGGKDNVQNAGPPSTVPVPKQGKKDRALAATGRLSFNLTTWFSGTVHVVVDGKGEITVIGKIAPPGEIILFPERSWIKEIVKLEAKAYYGIPVVGNLNLFANISLIAIAKLGPARLHKIEILGTYSTDPAIQKNIEIAGSINISAYGGLRLAAQGGAGIELLAHDLKFGIGLNADVGVKAYADARPTIGYRDPGVFYVSGTLDLVAQPMLGLGGEFFIELDAPWFSPLSDKRWSWPLFSKEWPLGDPIGMSATLKNYVLGSGQVPEIELKPPEFDPSKFMTNMVDDKLPNKSGGPGAGRGTFKEDGSVPKATVKSKVQSQKTAPANTKKKGKDTTLSKSAKRDAKAEKDAKSTAILQKAAGPLTALKGKGPLTRGSLDEGLAKIRKQVSGIAFASRSSGAKWLITPKAGSMAGKGLEIGAKSEAGASGIDWGKLKAGFKAASGEPHGLSFSGQGRAAKLMMASKRPRSIEQVLSDPKLKIENADTLRADLAAINAKIAAGADIGTKSKREQVKFQGEVQALVNDLAAKLGRRLKHLKDLPPSVLTFGGGGGRASYARAEPLTKNPGNTTGSAAKGRLGGPADAIVNQFVPKGAPHKRRDKSGNKYTVSILLLDQIHLVHAVLHGPFSQQNIALGDKSLNGQMRLAERAAVKAFVTDKVSYTVNVAYFNDTKPVVVDPIPDPIVPTVQGWVGYYIAKSMTVVSKKWKDKSYSIDLTGVSATGTLPAVATQVIEPAEVSAMKALRAAIDPAQGERKFGAEIYVGTKFNRESLRLKLELNKNQMNLLSDKLYALGVMIGFGRPLCIWIKK